MAAPTFVDISNFSTLLVQSTQGRAGTPDGNIFFDTANDLIEIITFEELAQVDLGGGLEDNPLTNDLAMSLQALYAFEKQERNTDNSLRTFRRGADGRFAPSGAFQFINGVKLYAGALSTTGSDDRNKIRNSGWSELSASGQLDRVYFTPTNLNDMQATSTAYYILAASTSEADQQAGVAVDFAFQGFMNQAVQVFGSTANGDAAAGDFDSRSDALITKLRTFGFNFSETNNLLANAPLDAYSTGFGLGESDNSFNTFAIADVFGGAAIAPFTGMSLERLAVPQVETGFNEADGNFTWVLHNTAGGTVDECAAYLDALAIQDADIDSGTGTYNGRRGREWYTRDTQGRMVTNSIDDEGLFIEGLSTAQQQLVVNNDDGGNLKTYPFVIGIQIEVTAAWVSDPDAWCQVMYADGAGSLDFDTASAVIVTDSNSAQMVFTNADAVNIGGRFFIQTTYDYDANTEAGLAAGVDKDIVVLAAGTQGAVEVEIATQIVRQAQINIAALSPTETNL